MHAMHTYIQIYIHKCSHAYMHTSHHIASHLVALHYITLHYITLHYMHTYMRTHIHIYVTRS